MRKSRSKGDTRLGAREVSLSLCVGSLMFFGMGSSASVSRASLACLNPKLSQSDLIAASILQPIIAATVRPAAFRA